MNASTKKAQKQVSPTRTYIQELPRCSLGREKRGEKSYAPPESGSREHTERESAYEYAYRYNVYIIARSQGRGGAQEISLRHTTRTVPQNN